MPKGPRRLPDYSQMSQEEYDASAGPGRRWVYHATDHPENFAEGVKMADVPQTLARRRHAAGEYAEYSPGNGVGQGTYVASEPWVASGFGRHMMGISVPTEHLSVPPETGGNEDIERHLKWSNGALLTHDVAPEHVADMGKVRYSSLTGLEHHQTEAMHAGRHVPEENIGPRVRGMLDRARNVAATAMLGGQW